MRTPVLLALGVIAAALTVAASSDAQIPTATSAIAALNAYRAAHGFPASIVEQPSWSADCANHDNWMELNHIVSHPETPGTPGYTDSGNWAGLNAVLASEDPTQPDSWWLPNSPGPWRTPLPGRPLEESPLHLVQLLAPRLAQMGVAMSDGFVCATTWPGYTGPAPAAKVVYSEPSNAESDVPYSEQQGDGEFTAIPGWPQDGVTGPLLYVFADGPSNQVSDPAVVITSAQLTSASGETVPVAVIDGSIPNIGFSLPNGNGIIVPTVPLRPSTRYTASIHMFSPVRGTWDYTWSFTTQPPLDRVDIYAIFLLSAGRNPARTLDVRWKSVAHNVTVTVTREGATAPIARRTVTATSGSGRSQFTQRHAWQPGRYSVCLSSGGSGTGWDTTHFCRTITIALRHGIPALISIQ